MKYLILSSFLLMGCGKELAPEVLSVNNELDNGLVQLLQLAIEDEACEEIEEAGFECNIPSQLHAIRFEWEHDNNNTVNYHLQFCLKRDCVDVKRLGE